MPYINSMVGERPSASAREANENWLDCFRHGSAQGAATLTQLYNDALAPSGLRSTQLSTFVELATRPPPTNTG